MVKHIKEHERVNYISSFNRLTFGIGICSMIIYIAISSCQSQQNKELRMSLSLAKENRYELQKVLNHYKNDPSKLEAAEFLIANMSGSFSRNNEILDLCQPFYAAYDSLAKIYNYQMDAERGKKIDSLWKNFSYQHPEIFRLPYQFDIETISAEQLISEIDLSFQAWQENVYSKNCSFDEFCEYILPYRRMNGLIIDDARKVFYERHHGKYFTQGNKDMIEEADSLLYQYHHLTHSQFWGTQIPIPNASTFEYLRHGLCEHRCWYNSLLFSSLGMAVAVDFVPAWGNRNNSHTWNVLIKDGKSYAFESFWDRDRWKYKRIYNNETFDYDWGRFRVAKVYRHSFKNYIEGPITNKKVKMEDIPDLFKNIKKKDVSHEYFDTVNVTITLNNIPKGTYYAYLCVYNYNEWQPVQWGEISKNKVTFKGMGKDVVYLPCYFKNGSIEYADEPFLLTSTEEIHRFEKDLTDTEDLYIKHYAGAPLHYGNKWNNISISGTIIAGSTSSLSFIDRDTLAVFPDTIEIYNKKIPSLSDAPLQYVRVSLPYHKIAYSNLSFFYKDKNGTERKIKNIKLVHPPDSTENGEIPDYMFDEYVSTGYKKELKEDHIVIDLGKEYSISSIEFAPYFEAGLKENVTFELQYWDNGWKSLAKQKGSNKHLVFHNVPKGALFLLKHENVKDRPGSRPFIYHNHEVLWH